MKKASIPLLPRTNLKKINELCIEGKFMMQPIRSNKFWESTDHEEPQPLPLKKKIGRTKQRRRMAEGEVLGQQIMSRQGAKITCSYCCLAGHNIKGCQLRKQQQPLRQGEWSSEETVREMQIAGPSESTVLQSTTRTPVTRRTLVSHETEQPVRRRQCRRWLVEGLAQAASRLAEGLAQVASQPVQSTVLQQRKKYQFEESKLELNYQLKGHHKSHLKGHHMGHRKNHYKGHHKYHH